MNNILYMVYDEKTHFTLKFKNLGLVARYFLHLKATENQKFRNSLYYRFQRNNSTSEYFLNRFWVSKIEEE